jgi:hypothetical protein
MHPCRLADVTIKAVTGEDPFLSLVQGAHTITLMLPQALTLVGAQLAGALNLGGGGRQQHE